MLDNFPVTKPTVSRLKWTWTIKNHSPASNRFSIYHQTLAGRVAGAFMSAFWHNRCTIDWPVSLQL